MITFIISSGRTREPFFLYSFILSSPSFILFLLYSTITCYEIFTNADYVSLLYSIMISFDTQDSPIT